MEKRDRYKITCLSLLFFFFLSIPGIRAEQSPGKINFENGLQFERQGELVDAEGEFLKAILLEPANPDYHFELAGLYTTRYDSFKNHSGEPKELELLERAAHEFEQVVMLRPDFLAAHYNVGVVYKHQRQFEKAREQFRRVLEMDPQAVNARIQLGTIYEEQGFFDEAKDEYLKAQAMDVNNPEIKSLIEDLALHKEYARQKTASEFSSGQLANLRNGLSDQNYLQQNSQQSGQAMKQAIPYLAQMLAQQFMSRFKKSSE